MNNPPAYSATHQLPLVNYYQQLNLHPSASAVEIRRAYRLLSKKYHPDTTALPPPEAQAKFQELNQAYAILTNPTRRLLHDQAIGYSRVRVMQAPAANRPYHSSNSAYLDPIDRPLSPGEMFVLLLLCGTFLICIGLVLVVAISRGELVY
jgi:curved DNA-binding protein CbpA